MVLQCQPLVLDERKILWAALVLASEPVSSLFALFDELFSCRFSLPRGLMYLLWDPPLWMMIVLPKTFLLLRPSCSGTTGQHSFRSTKDPDVAAQLPSEHIALFEDREATWRSALGVVWQCTSSSNQRDGA